MLAFSSVIEALRLANQAIGYEAYDRTKCAIFFLERGEIRDRSFESRAFDASAVIRRFRQLRLESFGRSGSVALLVPNQTEGARAEIDCDQCETSGIYMRTRHQVGDHRQMGAGAYRHADGFVGGQ